MFEFIAMLVFLAYVAVGVIVVAVANAMIGPEKTLKKLLMMIGVFVFWPAIIIYALISGYLER